MSSVFFGTAGTGCGLIISTTIRLGRLPINSGMVYKFNEIKNQDPITLYTAEIIIFIYTDA